MADDRSTTGAGFTRRRAITYGVGATTAVMAPGVLETVRPHRVNRAQAAIAATVNSHRELRHPRVLRSRHGRLHVRLTCRPGIVHMGAPKPVRTYTYDGVVPGYTWELWGGDVLTVDLRNHLPKLAHRPKMTMDRPHAWTTTNLHTHGLHVSPERQRRQRVPGDPAGSPITTTESRFPRTIPPGSSGITRTTTAP